MKILIAPLNWGLGHATRCIPLIDKYLKQGNEIVIAGDGDSLLLLKRRYPTIRILHLAPLDIRYSASQSQVLAMLKALPKIIYSSMKDHYALQELLEKEDFDLIISDNRFGMFISRKWRRLHPEKTVKTVYLTHQLNIRLPRFWKFSEPLASRLHRCIYNRYDEIWVPDYADADKRLAGYLSAGGEASGAKYIGPLSRFATCKTHETIHQGQYQVVALLSGIEPQRSILEKEIVSRYENRAEQILVVRGNIKLSRCFPA